MRKTVKVYIAVCNILFLNHWFNIKKKKKNKTLAHHIVQHQELLDLNCLPLSSPQSYDATVLAESYSGPELDILIDQGRDDQFLSASQLLPDNLIAACSKKKIPVVFRLQQVSTEPTQDE